MRLEQVGTIFPRVWEGSSGTLCCGFISCKLTWLFGWGWYSGRSKSLPNYLKANHLLLMAKSVVLSFMVLWWCWFLPVVDPWIGPPWFLLATLSWWILTNKNHLYRVSCIHKLSLFLCFHASTNYTGFHVSIESLDGFTTYLLEISVLAEDLYATKYICPWFSNGPLSVRRLVRERVAAPSVKPGDRCAKCNGFIVGGCCGVVRCLGLC